MYFKCLHFQPPRFQTIRVPCNIKIPILYRFITYVNVKSCPSKYAYKNSYVYPYVYVSRCPDWACSFMLFSF